MTYVFGPDDIDYKIHYSERGEGYGYSTLDELIADTPSALESVWGTNKPEYPKKKEEKKMDRDTVADIVITDHETGVTIVCGRKYDDYSGWSSNYPTVTINGENVGWTFGIGDMCGEEAYKDDLMFFDAIKKIQELSRLIVKMGVRHTEPAY